MLRDGAIINPQLVIFDCDGVLVDTETIAAEVTRDTLGELGWNITFDEAVAYFMGRSAKDNVQAIGEKIGHDKAARYLDLWRKNAGERMAAGVRAVPGVRAALEAIGLKTCVASSGTHEKMRVTLPSAGLYDRFAGRIYSASEVANGKPAPDLFLHAAAQMNTAPEACVVVEDSVPGVKAARAAGMRVFGYAALTSRKDLETAGAIVFEDMLELPDLVKSL